MKARRLTGLLLLGVLAGGLAEEPAAEDKFAGVLAAEPAGKVAAPALESRANKVCSEKRAFRARARNGVADWQVRGCAGCAGLLFRAVSCQLEGQLGEQRGR